MALHFITSNAGKFAEVKAHIPRVEQLTIDLPEIQDLNPRVIAEAKLKAALANQAGEFIVEDTGLFFDCLKGDLPGPFIKWFEQSLGLEQLAALASTLGNAAAYAQTIFGYSNGTEILFFEGSLRGRIVSPRGENGFGWDAIFEVAGSGKTLAELSPEEKNAVSHRAQALAKLKDFLGRQK